MGVIWTKSRFSEIGKSHYLFSNYNYFLLRKKIDSDKSFLVKRIVDYFDIISGFAFSSKDYQDEGSSLCRIGDISKTGGINLSDMKKLPIEYTEKYKSFLIKNGDILIGMTGDGKYFKTGFVENLTQNILLNQRVGILRLKETKKGIFNPKFLSILLQTNKVQNQIRIVAMGKTQKNVSPFDILNIKIPDINLKKQNEIVNKIIPIEQEIKQLKDSKKDILEIINEVFEQEFNFDWKTSEEYLDKLFHKINFVSIANNELKFDISLKYRESFEIAKKKVKVKLIDIGKIAQIKGGKRLPKGQNVIEEYTGYKYVRVDDLNWDGTFDIDNIKYISKENHLKIKNYIAKKDDILLTIVGATVGKCGIVPEELDNKNITENFARITINNKGKILPKYFEYCLQSNICQFQFDEYTGKASQGKLALFRIKKVQIPYIDINRQIQIIEKIKSKIDAQKEIDKKIEEKQNKINELIENSIML